VLNNYSTQPLFTEREIKAERERERERERESEGEKERESEDVERKNVTGREEGREIKLRRRRERQIASALVCHLYDLSVREPVKLNSGVV